MSELKKKVCIIDFKSGNIASVSNLLDKLKIDYEISNDNKVLEKSTHFILPGVGSFEKAITKLKNNVDINFLENEVFNKKKPILGICVGMQIMADIGNEFGRNKGLGWIKGSVDKIDNKLLPLPHIGWNEIKIEKTHKIFMGIDTSQDFYFVNSYYFNLNDKNCMIGSTFYGIKFPSVINKENVFGFQFHPEKSLNFGKKIILNFLSI